MSTHYESFGKYVLLEKLATGGMAEVFLARGTGAGGIGKFFAIKRILPQYADSPEFIDMFKDEAKIAINLSHSNIVSIHEFGVEKRQFFLVMDYVEGRNMRQILNKMKKSNTQFSVDQIVYMIKEVAAGLDHAHRCIDGSTGRPLNITHRDMSPQNVMVSFEGEVRIVDFGIAKAESQLETTRAGTLKGKFGYMSPEQAEGQPVDLRTDIFSLGIVLWELLANDRLFVANNEINTLRKIRDCQIPSLRKINPNIHTELERIVQKALARDRNLRYQTSAALHRDLNRFLNRQYPDFSSQDFSVFIKSVFADEILSLRKRLVEYAKVNLSVELTLRKPQGNALFDPDKGSTIVNIGTDSIIETNVNHTEGQQVEKTIEQTVKDDSLVSVSGAGTSSLKMAEVTKTERTPAADTVVDEQTRLKEGLLDDSAIAAEMTRERSNLVRSKVQPIETRSDSPVLPSDAPSNLETELVTSPSIRNERTDADINVPVEAYRRQKSRPMTFATFAVFGIFCLSIYIYLCKFYPAMMEPALKHTYAMAPALHDLVLGAGRIPASPNGQYYNRPPAEGRPILPPDSPSALVVTSNPSGAEIYVNGVNTGALTPQTIEVSPTDKFNISLRKRGYVDYKRSNVTREALGSKMDAALEKMNVGILQVEIFPPQEAVLYIGNRKLTMYRTMTTEISLPANRPMKIRAEARNGETFDEITISVPLDRKKSIRLNPRKNPRLPSSVPNQ